MNKIKSVARGVKAETEISLVVQWLRHRTPTGGDTGSILVRELRSCALCSMAKEMKNKINGQAVVKTLLKTSQENAKINLILSSLRVSCPCVRGKTNPPCFAAYSRP